MPCGFVETVKFVHCAQAPPPTVPRTDGEGRLPACHEKPQAAVEAGVQYVKGVEGTDCRWWDVCFPCGHCI